ncbi:Chaperonin-like RbcX [Ostreococcus tauri]|jgi:hypothetical protein|uniref:Chaperonin-like RbcX n=1 Tax=Ostreococcus tauri TaxID=70448 RepID=A0A096P7I9_OSTTA|nr:Chaperonin-like RbcX [Ostreococcus tauri]CEF97018.1 Chaperonin-like RbcX [Ostreococcus tauri]|eukprot:XP_022838436.1 Chaperonin-like RbcX [Ostreococcus tauri]
MRASLGRRAVTRANVVARGGGRPGRVHVPSDAFQGRSPEIAARDALGRLFTAVAARAVIAEESEAAIAGGMKPEESERYEVLKKYVEENPIRDGNAWMAALMERDDVASRMVALRVLELRKTYAEEVFDFERVREQVISEVRSENDRLMSEYVKRLM